MNSYIFTSPRTLKESEVYSLKILNQNIPDPRISGTGLVKVGKWIEKRSISKNFHSECYYPPPQCPSINIPSCS